jgi:hypothetical protein
MSDAINFELPSPETLAGIYLCVEGEEDVTVRPRQIPPVQIGSKPANGANGETGRAASIEKNSAS